MSDESTRNSTGKPPDDTDQHGKPETEARTVDDDDTHFEPDTTHDTSTVQPSPAPSTRPPEESHHTTPTTLALLTTSPPNTPRLSQILLHYLLSSSPDLPLSTAQSLIHAALSHIHIFQPTSLSSLIATLSSLPTYFLDPKNISAERKLGAIIIDSPSTYFWTDKMDTQEQRQGQQGQSKFPALASTLKRVSVALSAPIVFSSQYLSTTSDAMALRPQLPSPFSTLPTLRLMISRHGVRGFDRDTDAETAVKYQSGRDKAVREGRFKVSVNRWASDGRGEEHGRSTGGNRQGDGGSAAEGFEVRIDGEGITLL